MFIEQAVRVKGQARRWVLAAAVALACGLGAAPAAAQEAAEGVVRVAPGAQQTMVFTSKITRVATSNPDVVGLNVSSSNELLITARTEGSSVISVWTQGSESPAQSTVVVAATSGGRLGFGTQVQTDIRILEVSRSRLNALGFEYSNIFDGGNTTIGIDPTGLASEGFKLSRLGRNSTAVITALESGGFAYTLAEPSLTALSGQTATFLSGGEFPVPSSSGGSNSSIQIEYKSFGIGVALTPTVVDENQIILKVAPEVSELDYSSAVQTGGVAVPGLRVRRSETTVSMAPGETFIISGLVSRSTTNASDRVPGLGNIPVLGAFFRSTRIEREDKELVMVVTPRLVSPSASTMPPGTLPGAGYHDSSMGWLDMVTETRPGSEPIRHGLSW